MAERQDDGVDNLNGANGGDDDGGAARITQRWRRKKVRCGGGMHGIHEGKEMKLAFKI